MWIDTEKWLLVPKRPVLELWSGFYSSFVVPKKWHLPTVSQEVVTPNELQWKKNGSLRQNGNKFDWLEH